MREPTTHYLNQIQFSLDINGIRRNNYHTLSNHNQIQFSLDGNHIYRNTVFYNRNIFLFQLIPLQ